LPFAGLDFRRSGFNLLAAGIETDLCKVMAETHGSSLSLFGGRRRGIEHKRADSSMRGNAAGRESLHGKSLAIAVFAFALHAGGSATGALALQMKAGRRPQ